MVKDIRDNGLSKEYLGTLLVSSHGTGFSNWKSICSFPSVLTLRSLPHDYRLDRHESQQSSAGFFVIIALIREGTFSVSGDEPSPFLRESSTNYEDPFSDAQ